MTERDAPGVTPEPTPFVDDLLDIAANVRPALLKTIVIIAFGALLAVAPGVARWIIVLLVLVLLPHLLHLRGRLTQVTARLREAEQIERGAGAALRIAFARVDELEAELAEMRQRPGGATNDPVYRSVGLDVNAPDYVIEAARRAHRVALHPDKQRPNQRQAAHERYVVIDAAFDEILQRRCNASRS